MCGSCACALKCVFFLAYHQCYPNNCKYLAPAMYAIDDILNCLMCECVSELS